MRKRLLAWRAETLSARHGRLEVRASMSLHRPTSGIFETEGAKRCGLSDFFLNQITRINSWLARRTRTPVENFSTTQQESYHLWISLQA